MRLRKKRASMPCMTAFSETNRDDEVTRDPKTTAVAPTPMRENVALLPMTTGKKKLRPRRKRASCISFAEQVDEAEPTRKPNGMASLKKIFFTPFKGTGCDVRRNGASERAYHSTVKPGRYMKRQRASMEREDRL